MTEKTHFSPVRNEIAGVSVASLAQEFGTPTFAYDAAKIRERINDLKAFDVVRYAQKACSNINILELIRKEGVLVDAVSGGEIRRALAAGYAAEGDAPPIVYTADIFDRDALDLCIEHNIHVNCGSPEMIDQLGERRLASKAKTGGEITLRINPGFGHGHSQKTNTGGKQSKHGIWFGQIADCLARAKKYNLTVTGIHMHIGSGTDMEHLAQICGAMEQAAVAVGPSLTAISVGGGLPTIYRESDAYVDLDVYYSLCNAMRLHIAEKFGRPIRLEIEPGRYLVAESGYLITEIRAVKRQDDNLFYLLDAGFNNLARPILYGSYHPMSICSHPHPLPEGEGALQEVIVGGPLCESGDIFTQEEGGFVSKRTLPEAKVGDYLVIECAGAYGFVMGSNYNSRTFAAEILIEKVNARLIRRRQTFEEMISPERIG